MGKYPRRVDVLTLCMNMGTCSRITLYIVRVFNSWNNGLARVSLFTLNIIFHLHVYVWSIFFKFCLISAGSKDVGINVGMDVGNIKMPQVFF